MHAHGHPRGSPLEAALGAQAPAFLLILLCYVAPSTNLENALLLTASRHTPALAIFSTPWRAGAEARQKVKEGIL
jgi:hypothetical protein